MFPYKPMEYLNTLLLLTAIALLAKADKKLEKQRKTINKIMTTQAEFDEKINAANATLDGLVEDVDAVAAAVAAEAQQIRDFIAANPTLDTSALDGVQARLAAVGENLDTMAASVEGIFVPVEEEEETEPEPEPVPEV